MINGVSEIFFTKSQINEFLSFIEKYTPKTLIVLPYTITNETRADVYYTSERANTILNRSLQIVYLGQLYGEGMGLSGKEFVVSTMRMLGQGKAISTPSFDIDIYVISILQLSLHYKLQMQMQQVLDFPWILHLKI